MYAKPKSKDPLGADKQDVSDKLISLFYGVLIPMLNPIIYSLRNKDVKAAVRSLVETSSTPYSWIGTSAPACFYYDGVFHET
ncbi:hypothetical protein H8959_012646 [Pygathrix nigripes]